MLNTPWTQHIGAQNAKKTTQVGQSWVPIPTIPTFGKLGSFHSVRVSELEASVCFVKSQLVTVPLGSGLEW